MAENVQIVIEAVNKATAELQRARQDMQNLEGGAERLKGSFDKAAASVAAWVAGFASVSVATQFIKDSIAAALEAEQETAQLKRQVDATGVSWEKYGGIIEDVVAQAAEYGHVQDEEVSAALRQMLLITNDVAGSTQNLTLVMDLAQAKGIDLSTSAMLVGKAMEGDVMTLQRFLPELKKLDEDLGKNATSSQKAEAALKLLHDRVDGAAAAMPEAVKQVKDFQNAWEDFKENTGKLLLPMFTEITGGLADITGALGDQIEEINKANGAWETFKAFLNFFKELRVMALFGETTAQLEKSAEGFKENATAAESMNFVLGDSKKILEELPRPIEYLHGYTKQSFEEMTQFARRAGANIQEYLGKRIVEEARATADAIGNLEEWKGRKIRDESKATYDQLRANQEMAGRIAQQQGQRQVNEMKRQQDELKREYDRIWDQIRRGIGDAIAGAIVYGDNLKETFKNIGRQILADFISTLVQMGVEYAAQHAIMQAFAAANPIIQPVVPVMSPGGTATAAATSAGASSAAGAAGAGAAGTGGLIAAHGGTGATAAAMDAGVAGGTAAGAGAIGPTTAAGTAAVVTAAFIAWDPSLVMGGQDWDRTRILGGMVAWAARRGQDPKEYLQMLQETTPNSERYDWEVIRKWAAYQIGKTDPRPELSTQFLPDNQFMSLDPTLYGLEHGGIVTEPGMYAVGEGGKDEAVLPLEDKRAMAKIRTALSGGMGGVTIQFLGPVMGDRQQAREFALMIDRELHDLKIRNLSLAFSK